MDAGIDAPHREQLARQLQSQLPPEIGRFTPNKLPIVYHPKYNISFFGIERLHPFDSHKYRRVLDGLQQQQILRQDQTLEPGLADDALLQTIHTQQYLQQMATSRVKVAEVLELPPVALLPMFLIHRLVMQPMRYHVAGTVMAAAAAVQHGWSINLGGGMHHAAPDDGSGWCPYADINIAIRVLRTASNNAVQRVLVIDLDVHQGNGVGRCKLATQDKDIIIADAYNGDVFPRDTAAKQAIDFEYVFSSGCTNDAYLHGVQELLHTVQHACEKQPVDLIIYNAGTDVLEGDPLGRIHVSAQGITQRDEMVFKLAHQLETPICMLLSGGYAKDNYRVVLASITNLLNTFSLIPGGRGG